MVKVSLIVPMYNVKDYIRQCLDSLSAQTLKDMEIILVDDGCTDETPEIAETYVNADPERFHLYHKANGGLSDARNYGIPYAKGSYIAFLDSDDFVDPQLYERLSKKMDEGYDVVLTDIEYWYEDPTRRFVMKGLSDWKSDTIQKQALLSPMFAWNKMYKASFFQEKGARYPVGTWYEDTPVTTMIFANSDKIGYLNETMIHYRQREGSIMASSSDQRVKDIFNVMRMVRDSFANAGLAETYHDELEYLHIEHLRLYGMFRFIRSPYWKELFTLSDETMHSCFPNWKQNRYLQNLSTKNQIFLKYYNRGTAWIFNRVIRRGE